VRGGGGRYLYFDGEWEGDKERGEGGINDG